ncbi:MAG: hypothetical protein WCK01_03345 [Candidatus Uhrbacteria bacterium]
MNNTLSVWLICCITLLANTLPATAGAIGFIKGSGPTVYWVGNDGKRYVFPNGRTYESWFYNGQNTEYRITTLQDSQLSQFPLGGNVTYRPAVRLVKIQTDPKVYAVAGGGVLRWITSEAIATQLYGYDWNQKVDDVPVEFFVNYSLGEDITYAYQFNVVNALNSITNPDNDRSIKQWVAQNIPPVATPPIAQPFAGQVSMTADQTAIYPPAEPNSITFRTTVTNATIPTSNLRIDIYNPAGAFQKNCTGAAVCEYTINYQHVVSNVDVQYYAIVSDSQGNILPRAYSPTVLVRPSFSKTTLNSSAQPTLQEGYSVVLTGKLVLPSDTNLSTLTTLIIDRRDGQVIKTCHGTDICNADAYPVYRPGGNNTIHWTISASDQYGNIITSADSADTVITRAP